MLNYKRVYTFSILLSIAAVFLFTFFSIIRSTQPASAAVSALPVVSDIPDQTVAEGSTFVTITLDDYVSDLDHTDEQITWTYSGNTELTVDITDRVATITTPDADWFGAETVVFTATDPGSEFASDSATFTVTNVNDTPVVSDIPDQTIAEGASFTTITLDNYVSDVDNADADMIWTYSGNIELSVDITDRVATITTPNADWFGTETVVFTATDPGILSASDPATFTVTAVNDAPVVSDIPDQTIAEGASFTTITLDNYVSDVDNADTEMTWTYSGNSELTVDITDRIATINTPSSDWNGAETIVFTATDPGLLSASDPATFTVTSQNDTPVVSDIPDQTIAEGASFTTITLDNYVSDADNTDAEMTWTYSGDVELSVDITDRIATITTPHADWFGAETIVFTATDPGLLSASDPATFTVTPINDPPVVSDIPDQTIPHGDDFTTINLDGYVSDIDNSDSEMIWTYSGNSELTVDITNRVATISKPNPDWSGAETITFRATDPSTAYDEDAATFTVSDPIAYGISVVVNQGSDDAEERIDTGAVDVSSGDLELIRDSAGEGFDQIVGLRFRNIQIPPLAVIETAYIEFETDEETNINPCVLYIHGQASDNPSTFRTYTHNISNRTQTSASESWYPGNWNTENEKRQTDDISHIVQELVNRGGWSAGNAMAFTFEGTGQRVAKSYEFEIVSAPRLVISYTVSAGPKINITGIPLSIFISAPGVPSAVQSYNVSGENLNGDIYLSAPTDFQISTSSSSGFGSSVTLHESGGTVSSTPIYVRFNRATEGSSTGNISHTSTGATTRNLEVSGTTSDIFSVDFQQGFSSYSGTVDTYIRQTSTDANTNFSADIWLEWDNNFSATDEVTLIRFENLFSSNGGPIPDGSTIAAATLRYVVTAAPGGPAEVYESLVDWPETTVTWNNFGGEAGVQIDEYHNYVTSAPSNLANTAFSIDVTDSLVRWSSNPDDNLGWIFLAVNDDSTTIHSSDASTPAFRPRLSVDYSTGGTLPSCYALTLSHTGNGSDIVADPIRSTGCRLGQYLEGEAVDLSGAVPDPGWVIGSWTNTNNDSSTDSTNSVTIADSAISVSVNYTDTIPPDTVINTYPVDPTTNVNASFSFTSTETGSTFECQLDSGGFSTCTSPRNYSGLSDGLHTFEVRATDLYNNTDPTPATYSWTIDTTPPETSITSNPADPTNNTNASFSFTSTEGGSTFECRIDSGSFTACSSPQVYSSLAVGTHTFEVRATDALNNTDPTPASFTWEIDTSAPDTNITDAPADPTNSVNASFSFTSTETGSTFECQLDGGGYQSCGSPQVYTSLSESIHTFNVRATDPAGNIDMTPDSYTWEIDTTPPNTTITIHPDDPSDSSTASFSFTSTEFGSTFECQIDDGGFSICTSPHVNTLLGDGDHTFAVRATDPAGNTDSSPATYTWEIDTIVPDTGITAYPDNPTNDTEASFSFTSTKPGSTFECQIDGGGYSSCTSPRQYSGLPDGSHTFSVRATDSVGNTDPTPASYSWIVDTIAPDTSITTHPSDPSRYQDASFTFTSTETGATFECQIDGAGFSTCTSPLAYTNLDYGFHTFDVRSTDAAGNTDLTPASYIWTIQSLVYLPMVNR